MQPPLTDAGEPVPQIQVRPSARRAVLIMSGLLYATGTFGSSVAPAWIDNRPEVVLALSARNRNLFASVPFIDPLSYSLIGFARGLLVGVTLFFLGRWYGDTAIKWTEGQIGEMPAMYRWFQRAVDKAGWLMLLLMPGSNLVCMMAGYRRMRPDRFVAIISVGIAAKMAVLWAGGKVFEDQIRSFLDAISSYQWYVVGGLFAIAFLQALRQTKRSLPQMIHELEDPPQPADEQRVAQQDPS